MSKGSRIQDCIDHHDEYILTLASMPDHELVEKLDSIHLQTELAEQQRDADALALLEVWRAQTIEARTYKAENNIPDAINEIEEAIADIETHIAVPDPAPAVIDQYEHLRRTRRQPPAQDEKSEQLSIF